MPAPFLKKAAPKKRKETYVSCAQECKNILCELQSNKLYKTLSGSKKRSFKPRWHNL